MDSVAQQQQFGRTRVMVLIGWCLLLLAVVFAYVPGLGGPFVFDDFGSIKPLGDLGGVRDWTTFKAFVFGGNAGPTGRPLALLTFLLDGNNWPTDPWPFKRTNLVIHGLNGLVLGVIVSQLGAALGYDRQKARVVALVTAGVWLLHPFLVSTTLYAVQRMAQLSTLFVLLGIAGYLKGRTFLNSNPRQAYIVMSVAVAGATLLAMLSKENGILLPLLIGVLEITVFATARHSSLQINRFWLWLFVVAPTLVIVLYLGEKVVRGDFFDVVMPRDFSMYERLLTQPRVLFDYLQNWYFPKLYTSGVFQDHFVKSSSLLNPVTTLATALLHVATIVIAFAKRREWPVIALAVLFFYASHLLESTVINLELYFEHRNYLAAAFLFLPIVVALYDRLSGVLFAVVSLAGLLLLTGFTHYSATIWADYPAMVEAAARKAPTSARAQAQYAVNLYNAGRYDESLAVANRAIENNPDSAFLILTRSSIQCELGQLDDAAIRTISARIASQRFDPRAIALYTQIVNAVVTGRCPNATPMGLRTLFTDMLDNPDNANPKSLLYSQIQYLIGFLDASSGRPAEARDAFEKSLQARPGPAHSMLMAAVMASNQYFDNALYFSAHALERIEEQGDAAISKTRVRKSDVLEFRATVLAEKQAAESGDSDD